MGIGTEIADVSVKSAYFAHTDTITPFFCTYAVRSCFFTIGSEIDFYLEKEILFIRNDKLLTSSFLL